VETPPVVTCKGCDRVLDEDPGAFPKPPCPYCGSTARHVELELAGAVQVSGRLELVKATSSLAHDLPWLVASVVLAVGGAAVGTWLVEGWLSFVVSLALAAIGFVVGVRATMRVVERETFRA
jgi:hypothetical protein